MKFIHFKDIDFLPAIKALFKELKVPMNYVADEPTTAKEILKDTYKDNTTFQLVDDVYFVGMVDDAAFEGNKSLEVNQIKSDYDGVLVFGLSLHQRTNNLLPNRAQLAEISRAFNREFFYTPVVLVFKYKDDQADYLAFSNTERLQYKQAWREGEKAGKVSLLRDINIAKPHRGHEDIIDQLRIPTSGTKAVDSFAKLYTYWQEVFSVSVLNKKFYQELSNWYFWAIKNVTFPNKPTPEIAHHKGAELDDLIQEHNATNVIRLLTRLLFTWFIKEKKLISEDLFDLEALQKNILKEISPYHEEGIFKQSNQDSVYYKAILQNLFFASLNCPIESDGIDHRTRGFRGDGYGTHRGIDYLMRYKASFKNPDAFLEMMNKTVPFLNGGLFECLDDKYQNLYIDGFSDQMAKGEQLIVPDYLFFGIEEHVDLSREYGVSNKGSKEAAVKGLVNILKSYKFTITENTPIEEDVALDPELLGKVFENLLASYNPETKTTARKQTGSFYTPREIVNYMVDESLIAYLKNAVTDWAMDEKVLDEKLHQLTSFDPVNPFSEDRSLTKRIVKALDECKILDPACGSGAFPMGILQKMVHMLQKLDPENEIWKAVQIGKTERELKDTLNIDDKKEREEKLKEINEAFDQSMNDPDYARKLYLIENCIYGVDIQPIASQISKLRFFISLVVDQKPTYNASQNFGVRPLPNLETKFVTANTLIGIEKPKTQTSLFDTKEIKQLEAELKKVRHKLFSARTKDTKLKYRQKDEELRNAIAEELKRSGWQNDSAEKLAAWDPYDQNASSPFFDPEWMFDISDGFDVVIGNPPYLKERDNAKFFEPVNKSAFGKKWHQGKMDFWFYFLHKAIDLSSSEICFITSRYWLNSQGAKKLINRVKKNLSFVNIIDIGKIKVFDAVAGHHMVSHFSKRKNRDFKYVKIDNDLSIIERLMDTSSIKIRELNNLDVFKDNDEILFERDVFSDLKNTEPLSNLFDTSIGIQESVDKISSKQLENSGLTSFRIGQGVFVLSEKEVEGLNLNKKEKEYIKPYVDPNDISKYAILIQEKKFIIYSDKEFKNKIEKNSDFSNLKKHLDKFSPFITSSNKPYGLHRPRNQKYFESPKIIFKGMFVKPEFEYDDQRFYFGFSFTSIIQSSSNYSLKYLLAIINSSFALKWFNTHGKQRGAGVDIGVEKLRLFPVVKTNSATQSLISYVVDLARYYRRTFNEASNSIEAAINGLVFNLYFPDHMKERKIDLLEFVERDMEKLRQGREFDSLSSTEKEKVVGQLHTIWSHPDNEVRNRIKLFAVRSPDILKPILES